MEARRRTARELAQVRYLNPTHGAGWTRAELRLLGKMPDADGAARTGRSEGAVTQKRCLLGIPTLRYWRGRENG
jgi:hypothetical protein